MTVITNGISDFIVLYTKTAALGCGTKLRPEKDKHLNKVKKNVVRSSFDCRAPFAVPPICKIFTQNLLPCFSFQSLQQAPLFINI